MVSTRRERIQERRFIFMSVHHPPVLRETDSGMNVKVAYATVFRTPGSALDPVQLL